MIYNSTKMLQRPAARTRTRGPMIPRGGAVPSDFKSRLAAPVVRAGAVEHVVCYHAASAVLLGSSRERKQDQSL